VLDGGIYNEGCAVTGIDRLYTVAAVKVELDQIILTVIVTLKDGTSVCGNAFGNVVHLLKAGGVSRMINYVRVGNNSSGLFFSGVIAGNVLGIKIIVNILEEILDGKVDLDRIIIYLYLYIFIYRGVVQGNRGCIVIQSIVPVIRDAVVIRSKADKGGGNYSLTEAAALFYGSNVRAVYRSLNAAEAGTVKVLDGYGNVLGLCRTAVKIITLFDLNSFLVCRHFGHRYEGGNVRGIKIKVGLTDGHFNSVAVIYLAVIFSHTADIGDPVTVLHIFHYRTGYLAGWRIHIVDIYPYTASAAVQYLPTAPGKSKGL